MFQILETLFGLLFFAFFALIPISIILIIVKILQSIQDISLIHSHWSHMIEGLVGSTQEFYDSVEKSFTQKNVTDAKFSRVTHKESGLLSSSREYLRIQRKELVFDICAAPFGNGFFISWWMGESQGTFWGLVSKIPIAGNYLIQIFRPMTYYHLDTAQMFQSLVQSAVTECVDNLTNTKGLRLMTESERKPIMSQLFTSSTLSGR